ncbi:MAG: hypothetical protein RIR97_1216 [Pseudomonadota bacterium]
MEHHFASRQLRLQTLVRLRWLAVFGQMITVFFVHFVLNFHLPLLGCSALIAILAWVNFYLHLRFPPTHRLQPSAALAVLGFDLLQLTGLLYLTGGLSNPFAVLMCVPVIISSASLPRGHSLTLGLMAIGLISFLAIWSLPLPWYLGQSPQIEPIIQLGFWFAIILTTAFAAFYAFRVSLEASQLADALTATELVLQRENHLSALDGLAAAAAHELGTPLATISVVAKEMERELASDPRFAEDVALLKSQSARCRDILKRLTTLSTGDEQHMRQLPLSSLMEEVMAPHREFGIRLTLVEKSGRNGEPIGNRNPGIVYGLGNLIENAVDYAREDVTVTVDHNAETVRIVIEDDGEGYSADILARIGEPYVTNRVKDDRAGGLGLGLFIAKTLLERSGATVEFENRTNGETGARIIVQWPRQRMEIGAIK